MSQAVLVVIVVPTDNTNSISLFHKRNIEVMLYPMSRL